MLRETLLARTLVELADTLVDDFDVVDLLTLLTERCVEALDVTTAGLMLASPEGDLRLVASSSHSMHILESFELQTEEGPCLDCYRTGKPIVNLNLAKATHPWTRFAPLALEAGFRSVHAFPMHLRDQSIGALNLFRTDEGQMDDADVLVAQAFADVATIAILQHRATVEAQVLNDQLQNALNSRITIEQAKGMLAQSLSLDMEHAFARLRRYARDHNRRLVDVAHDLVSGNLNTEGFTQA
jgi:GAF domain-containing protein